MITLGLADDQQLFTSGVAMVIGSQPDLTVAWQASNGREALIHNSAVPADVILMDVQMPVLDGISATRELAAARAASRVIILTTFDTQEYVVEGLGAGAAGFLLKDTPPENLLTAIRTVHSGEAVISPRSTRRLLEQVRPALAGAPDSPAVLSKETRRIVESLTPRELEILIAVAKGWSNTEICERLFVSMPTVKTHVSHVLAKTGSRDRVQAVLFAFRSGLVAREDLLQS
ncbi:MAG: response regulator transcription factor [Propionibacteriaceae bacterium]|nr:response regulator transcription factor [Propionibacteriaceae bacterium]